MQEMHQHEEMHAAEPARQPHVQFSRDSICVSRKMLLTVGVLVGVFALGMLVSSGINNVGKAKIATKSRAEADFFQSPTQCLSFSRIPLANGVIPFGIEIYKDGSSIFNAFRICENGCNLSTNSCASNRIAPLSTFDDVCKNTSVSMACDGVANAVSVNCDSYSKVTLCGGLNSCDPETGGCRITNGGEEVNLIGKEEQVSTTGHGGLADLKESYGWFAVNFKDIKSAKRYESTLRSSDPRFSELKAIYGDNSNLMGSDYVLGDENIEVKMREVDDDGKPVTKQCHGNNLNDFMNVSNIISNLKYSSCSGARMQFSHSYNNDLFLVITYDSSFDEQGLISGRNTVIHRVKSDSIYELRGRLPNNIRYVFFTAELKDRLVEIGANKIKISSPVSQGRGDYVAISYLDKENGSVITSSKIDILDAQDIDLIN